MESPLPSAQPTWTPSQEPDPGLGGNLGPYELLDRLGRGGMGTVYRAMHTRLKRPAAIKILRSDRIEHRSSVMRFLREMEAVGRLDHPNLVRAYDAGEAEGRYFLAMELVVGADLCFLVNRLGPLGVSDACEAVRQAARGLQCAHTHGLVHRDVKPANLMLARDGTVKLLDLGLARLIDSDDAESRNTATDQILGTGDYLAPEQGEDPRQADARSDLYALGCVLYFLLAGQAPFDDTRHNTFGRKLLAHATERVPPIERLRTDLPEGLVRLIGQMLAKRPAARPASMAEIEQSLAAWAQDSNLPALVAHLPNQAVPADAAEVETPAPWGCDDTGREPRPSDARPSDARPSDARPAAGRRRRRTGPKLLAGGFAVLIIAVAAGLPRTRIETRAPERLSAAALVQRPAPLGDLAGWTLETRGGRATVTHLSLSPDERLLAAGDSTGCVRIWRTATGDLVRILVEREPIRAIAWRVCSRELAVAAGTLQLWDATTGHRLWHAPLSEDEAATSLDHGPDDLLASGHRNGEIRLWNLAKRRLSTVLPAHATPVTALRFSADGSRLASGEEGRAICIWSMPDGRPLHRFDEAEPGPIRRLAWSPEGTRLASCGGGKHVTVWDEAEAFRPRPENAANQPVGDLGWSGDGQRFFSVSGGEHGMEFAVLWDGAVRRQIHRPLMMPNAATAMAWSLDGAAVYCGVRSGELRIYAPGSDGTRAFRAAAATRTTAAAWSPGGSHVLLGDCTGFSRLWNTDEGEQCFAVRTSKHPVWVLAWHPEGHRFATGHTDGILALVDATTGSVQQQFSCNGHVFDVAFSPDGRWFATAEEHGLCRVWDAATGEESLRFPLEPSRVVNALAWSPCGRYLAFSAWDARVRMVDVEQGRLLHEWESGQGFVWSMRWEPESHVLLTSGQHGGIGHWDTKEGTLLRREEGCLREASRYGNALGPLQGSCASSGLRGIAPDGMRNIQPMTGSEVGVRDLATGQIQLLLCPMRNGHWLAIAPATGHYRADLSGLETPVYVVSTDQGQENYAPAEFAARYGWKNSPEKLGK